MWGLALEYSFQTSKFEGLYSSFHFCSEGPRFTSVIHIGRVRFAEGVRGIELPWFAFWPHAYSFLTTPTGVGLDLATSLQMCFDPLPLPPWLRATTSCKPCICVITWSNHSFRRLGAGHGRRHHRSWGRQIPPHLRKVGGQGGGEQHRKSEIFDLHPPPRSISSPEDVICELSPTPSETVHGDKISPSEIWDFLK